MSDQTLAAFDGHNLLFRAYYAMKTKRHLANSNKPITPAEVASIFLQVAFSDMKHINATHCAVVFDSPGGSFRNALYPEYKAQRSDAEFDVDAVLKLLKKLLKAMGLRVFCKAGIEGDDIVGSLAMQAYLRTDWNTYIVSVDKDFASLVRDRIFLLRPKKDVLDESGVARVFGVPPRLIVQYLMLLGDGVDNIPGVNNVGPKTAAKVLNEHGSIKKWLRCPMTPAMQKNVDAARPFFSVSHKLITIRTTYLRELDMDSLEIRPLSNKAFDITMELLDYHLMVGGNGLPDMQRAVETFFDRY